MGGYGGMGTYCKRSSKGRILQGKTFGDTSVRDGLTLHQALATSLQVIKQKCDNIATNNEDEATVFGNEITFQVIMLWYIVF
jgi:hypothetical protein